MRQEGRKTDRGCGFSVGGGRSFAEVCVNPESYDQAGSRRRNVTKIWIKFLGHGDFNIHGEHDGGD